MQLKQPLSRDFYNRSALEVAPELIGALLIHQEPNHLPLIGIITETEAYCGEEDLACHAKAGLTPRTAPMYGPPGLAYVYFNYGIHWLFNCVTQPISNPHAVLMRSVIPVSGFDLIQSRRGNQSKKNWTNGPAKLTQAFNIQAHHNNLNLTAPSSSLYLSSGIHIPSDQILTSPRIGLFSVPEPWKSIPWRFNASQPAQLLQQFHSQISPTLSLH